MPFCNWRRSVTPLVAVLAVVTVSLGLSLMTVSCDDADGTEFADGEVKVEPEGWDRLIGLESANLMLDVPAVTLRVGRDPEHCLSLTIRQDNIYEGYEDRAVRRDATARLSASIRAGRKTYTEMTDKDTRVRVEIIDLDREKKEALIHVSARLVDTEKNNRYFTVKTAVTVQGRLFEKLVAQTSPG